MSWLVVGYVPRSIVVVGMFRARRSPTCCLWVSTRAVLTGDVAVAVEMCRQLSDDVLASASHMTRCNTRTHLLPVLSGTPCSCECAAARHTPLLSPAPVRCNQARPLPLLRTKTTVQLLKEAELQQGSAPAKPKRPRALVLGPTRELTDQASGFCLM